MREIWTIGHWTCPEQTFVARLAANGIGLLADVRAHPGSRTSPQFSRDLMPGWLAQASVGYVHLEKLGGRRAKQDVDSRINSGWQNASFKNYADYTLLPAYQEGIDELLQLATERHVAVMCAEPMPWRCHRLLISNTLTARGWTVRHIVGDSEPRVHRLGQWGATPVVGADGRVTYPGPRRDEASGGPGTG
ncbi:MAG: DNA repair protein [Cellulomonas sp. 73-145]|uniref:DUF488 domain-containing protein n=1 Tax=Cellulomonas sp. 73-145 TaxID=1895739 RepID=UPI0009293F0E|nr:DUF488 domain-containing protein [Cellulomonas sp. 73-145]MBN9327862.1 DUF488 domain-containing protein [Cellulomonas sp.]OJV60857.1 MAG: DNA repair protein [Cellulomonas sp. 73-145]